ncbi:MAG: phosphonate C-P lyase system protein PhnL [Rhabdaerophilum sp.]
MKPVLTVSGVSKAFHLHLHGGKHLSVVDGVDFVVHASECVVLGGPSGAGKSSIMKAIYGNYIASTGAIILDDGETSIDVVTASPGTIIALRRHTMGYVSQFLRVIPRVSALEIVAEAARASGFAPEAARVRAEHLLTHLNLPEQLWNLPPATFSGGEQQRVNIARGFAGKHRFLILDEPTASLDAINREAVIALIEARKAEGTAFLGIFHDQDVRDRVADRIIDVTRFSPKPELAA